jgi:hypothetical protein
MMMMMTHLRPSAVMAMMALGGEAYSVMLISAEWASSRINRFVSPDLFSNSGTSRSKSLENEYQREYLKL